MRHGMAASTSGSDALRPLTKQGREDVAGVILNSTLLTSRLESVLTSPYRRARETAEIVVQQLAYPGQIEVCDELRPESSPRALIKYLDARSLTSVLLTTHQPLIGDVVNLLLGNRQLAAIEPGCLVALEAEILVPGCVEFCWIQSPSH
jgi:phosphohistidine phosphatase